MSEISNFQNKENSINREAVHPTSMKKEAREVGWLMITLVLISVASMIVVILLSVACITLEQLDMTFPKILRMVGGGAIILWGLTGLCPVLGLRKHKTRAAETWWLLLVSACFFGVLIIAVLLIVDMWLPVLRSL